jgi:hypothetical protein
LQGLLEMHTKSSNLEIQSRACEYGQLFRFSAIKGQLLEAMPALDEATYMARFNAPAIVASGPSLTTVTPPPLCSLSRKYFHQMSQNG